MAKAKPRMLYDTSEETKNKISRFAKRRPRDSRGRFKRILSKKEKQEHERYWAWSAYERKKKEGKTKRRKK